ncbi:MAG: FAD-dependent oxidoreductase, partial [Bifidobacteriaceae bacterium]|nr:FAD-dependent oxidoreductase [Bifidobacteriaceae bacterium]
MKALSVDLVVVGAGSTGCGVARDAAMRGFSVVLVDRADVAQGTSGRFHGLLHSGARYAVTDPTSAKECAQENAIVKRIHAGAVEDTGGLFVGLEQDAPDFADRFLEGCRACGLLHEEITPAEAIRREPRLNPRTVRAVQVWDGAVDGWTMAWGAVRSAVEYGARLLRYTEVAAIELDGGRVARVRCRGRRDGEETLIDTGFLINAGGPWCNQITALMGIHDIEVAPAQGVMVAVGHRVTARVLN